MITEIDATQFEGEVLGSAAPVLVEFFTPLCAPCRQMLPILDEIAGERGGALKVVKFNAGENPQFASQFRITWCPTSSSSGVVSLSGSGSVGKRDLLAWIDSSTA